MKRIIAIALLSVMIFLTGCGDMKAVSDNPESDNKTSMFIVVETTTLWKIVADRKTGVMYAVSDGGYNAGNFTLLVDAEGKPLIYKEEK